MSEPAIRITNITKSFGRGFVLKDFSENLYPGVNCVLGPSGCGKTTLLRILAGFLKPDSGEITGVSGKSLSMVFQEDRLLPWLSAKENISIVSKSTDAEFLLDQLELLSAADKRVSQLSGGMKRRVAFLRALSVDFDILLMDEPFKGLDARIRQKAMDLLKRESRNRERVVVLVTHDPYEADYLGNYYIELNNIYK